MTQKETLSKMSINEREERARAMNWRAHKTEQGTSVVSLAKESARDWDGYGKRRKMTTKKYERPKSGGRVSDCEGIGGITVDRICEISKQQRRYTVNRIDEIKKVRRRERE